MSSARRGRDRRGVDPGVLVLVAGALATGCDSNGVDARPSSATLASPDASIDAATPSAPVEVATRSPDADAAAASAPIRAEPCFAEQFPFAFISLRRPPGNYYELWLATADASEVRRVALDAHVGSPAWAPDGSAIAFRRFSPTTPSQSYVGLVGATGQPFVQLTAPEQYEDTSAVLLLPDGPTWSSDSQTIAFASRVDSPFFRIWAMSRSGGQRRLVMPDLEAPHHYASFARHDPRLLAFVLEAVDGSDVWAVDVDAPSERENLTRGRAATPRWPRWSPDGGRLAFAAEVSAPDAGGPSLKLFVLERSSDVITQVTFGESSDGHPTWSPDGGSLLFTRSGACSSALGCSEIFRLDLGGNAEPVALTATTANFWPDWYGGGACSGR